MNLRDALDVKVGSTPVNKIYKGTYKVWDRNKIALEGYCKQNTTEGKSLIDFEDIDSTANCTYNDNIFKSDALTSTGYGGIMSAKTEGTYEIQQTTTFYISADIRLVSGTFASLNFIGARNLARSNSSWLLRPNISSEFQRYCFKTDYESGNSITGFTLQLYNCDNAVLEVKNLMISTSNNYEFEPYTGGQPSPNPDYPQEIEVMQGRQVVPIRSENVLPNNTTTQTINGITFTKNKNGSIILNGTATNYCDFYFVGNSGTYAELEIEDGNYNLNGCIDGNGRTYMLYAVQNRNGNLYYYQNYDENGIVINIKENDTFRIFIRVMIGQTLDNVVIKPQLNKGLNALPYVPYKNEQYTVDLKSRNLFDVNDIYDKNSLYRKDEDDYITIEFDNSKGTTTKYFNYYTNKSSNLKLDTKYYIATEIKEVSGTGTINIASTYQTQSQIKNIIYYDLSGLKNNDIKVDEVTTVSDFTERITMIRTFVKAEAGQKGSITFRLSVLEEQPTVESFNYEPYYDYKLAGIGDYKDNFYTDKGKWYFKQNIGKIVLDGSENWERNATDTSGKYRFRVQNEELILNDSTTNIVPLLCDKFTSVSPANTYRLINGICRDNKPYLFICWEDWSEWTVAQLKSELANNNLIVYGQLANAIITEITAPTLINQLNALYQAM